MNDVAAPARVSGPTGRAKWIVVLDGQRLLKARQDRGLSKAQLARVAGICLATVSRLEGQPKVRCRPRTAVRLAEVLGDDMKKTLAELLDMGDGQLNG